MKSPTLSVFLLLQAQAFAPSSHHQIEMPRPLTELYGLRTFWRRRFSGSTSKGGETAVIDQTSDVQRHVTAHAVPEVSGQHLISTNTATLQLNPDENRLEEVDRFGGSLTLALTEDDKLLDEPHSLPPARAEELTRLEQEFRDMLDDFSQYTKRDIRAVRNPRMRALFEGVAASYSLPEVYRAFEVLFEDYAPLRVAGRLIYGKLKQVMVDAQEERHREVEQVASSTGMSKNEVEASRTAFLQMVVHEDDKATEMSIQQLVDYGLAEMTVEVLGYETFDEFVEIMEPKENQKVGFAGLMVALQRCTVDSSSPECNVTTVLQEVAQRIETRDSKPGSWHQGKEKLNRRYDGMVEKFKEWKELVPGGEGRRLDILRGCFVGAESKEIVEALRIVYMDYSALRMSGDLIFKVMAALVGTLAKRR